MAKNGAVIGMNSRLVTSGQPNSIRAQRNFAKLMTHVANLYCMDGSSSISAHEMAQLTASVAYVLGITGASAEDAARALCVDDPVAHWHERLAALDTRVDAVLATWRNIALTMPPIRNVALRDTLASLGDLKRRYDVHFAAHEVPCDIDYQLSEPVDTRLQGLDYIEAWLAQLDRETRWIARFETESCIAVLEHVCPDYRGLHVNLYDLLLPYEADLWRVREGTSRSRATNRCWEPSRHPATLVSEQSNDGQEPPCHSRRDSSPYAEPTALPKRSSPPNSTSPVKPSAVGNVMR